MSNTYQSLRQFFINPTYANLPDSLDVLNPNTVITSILDKQSNILRFEGQHPFHIENSAGLSNLLGSKSGVIMNRLIAKLFEDDTAFATTGMFGENFGLITIKNWQNYNLADYELFIFDEDGFKISTFKNTVWYVINGTLFILCRSCLKYSEDVFAENVNVVLLKKVNRKDPIVSCLLNWTEAEAPEDFLYAVGETHMEVLPESVVCDYSGLKSAKEENINWHNYSEEYYGLMLYISGYSVLSSDPGFEGFSEAQIASINSQLSEKVKFCITLDKSLYTVSKVGESIVFAFNDGIDTVEDLGISYDVIVPGYEGDVLNVRLRRLEVDSKFYALNEATYVGTEFSYTWVNNDVMNLQVSKSSSISLESIQKSIIGEQLAPSYIPLHTMLPTSVTDPEDEHIYTRFVRAEDVLVWVDGVKLVPNVNYTINDGTVGADYPANCIIFKSSLEPGVATNFPAVSENCVEHTIKVMAVPPTCGRNFYYGHNLSDAGIEVFKTGSGDIYPIISYADSSRGVDIKALSCLGRDTLLSFNAGRYVPSRSAVDSVVLNQNSLFNLKSIHEVEIRSYFDDNSDVDAIFDTFEMYDPFIDTVLNNLGVAKNAYVAGFCTAKAIEPLTEEESEDYRLSSDFIVGMDENSPIELWLRYNSLLKYKTDGFSETIRRVPDKQTYFSGDTDLSQQGYNGNITVKGFGTAGLLEDTATTDGPDIVE